MTTINEALAAWGAFDRDDPFPLFADVRALGAVHAVTLADGPPRAQRMIEAATGERAVGEPDLAPSHERWIGDWARREHGSDLVLVVGYPMVKRPFYTHPDPAHPEFSNSFDLVFRGIELVTGGGQRLHRYDD